MSSSLEVARVVAGSLQWATTLGWSQADESRLRAPLRPLLSDDQLSSEIAELQRESSVPILAATRCMVREATGLNAPGSSTADSEASFAARRKIRSCIPAELIHAATGRSQAADLDHLAMQIPQGCRSIPLGDGHVHSGGVSGPFRVLSGYFDAWRDGQASGDDLHLADLDGTRFAAYPLIGALAMSAYALGNELDVGRRDHDPGLRPLPLSYEEVWTGAWRASLSTDVSDERGLALLILLDEQGPPPMSALLRALGRYIASPDIVREASWREICRNAIAAVSLIHSSITSPDNSSLDEFVERFNYLRKLRRLSPERERQRIVSSLEFLSQGGLLRRLELRKTVTTSPAGRGLLDAYADIREDVRNHAEAVLIHRAVRRDDQIVVQMPATLLRSSVDTPQRSELDRGEIALRYPINRTIAAANAVVRTFVASDNAAKFVGGLDVVGREDECGNWLYSLAYGYTERALQSDDARAPHFSIHAGEQFGSPLTGLRRVGETRLFSVDISRIGHALALNPEVAFSASRSGRVAVEDALMDLAWARVRLRSATGLAERSELMFEVDRLLESISAVAFAPRAPSAGQVEAWYQALFDLDFMTRIGLVPDPASWASELFEAREVIRSDQSDRFDDPVERMAFAFVARGDFGGFAFTDAPLAGPLLDRYSPVADRLYSLLRPAVSRDLGSCVVEVCPSSNAATAGLTRLTDHPVSGFAGDGIAFTVNSDDPGVFGALVEEELFSLFICGCFGRGSTAESVLRSAASRSIDLTARGLVANGLDDLLRDVITSV